MFPLLDKAAKIRRPGYGNKKRISLFINDELENIIELGTGLAIKFTTNDQKIVVGKEGIWELFYRVRNSILHEAETPDNITFERKSGIFAFSFIPSTNTKSASISVPAQFCEIMLILLISCPEYSSIPKEFVGRRIKFGRHEIMPSQCIGNFNTLKKQLIFGT